MGKPLLYRAARKILGVKADWYRDKLWRRYMDLGRRRVWVNTPIDATFRLLELQDLTPAPIVALEVFGRQGLWKTVEYAHRCEYLELYEIEPDHARLAQKALPGAMVRQMDSVDAVNHGKLLRRDYSFVLIDSWIGCFGPGYCEHFDLFPRIFDSLADYAVICTNFFADARGAPAEVLERRRRFYGTDRVERLDYKTAKAAYLRHVPSGFTVVEAFPVAHPGDTVFWVMCVRRDAKAKVAAPAVADRERCAVPV